MNFTVKNKRTQSTFSATNQQTVLAAALESGLALPHSCRAGNCGSCKARLVSGKINRDEFSESALDEQQLSEGFILLCSSIATTDLEIEIEEFSQHLAAAKYWPSRIKSMKRLCHDVMRMILELPTGQKSDYLPGQYLDIVIADNRFRSFSIANASGNELEFHIRKVEEGEFSNRVFNELKVGDILRLYGPLGTFFLRTQADNPIIMLAGGSGFAPVKALLEQLQQIDNKRSVTLYWGVRTVSDIYMKFWLEQFAQSLQWFNYTVVLSQADDTWSGRKGFVHQAVIDDYNDLSDFEIYASGPPQMITAAKGSFIKKGLNPDNFYFDSFDYAADSLAQINQKSVTRP